MAGKIEGMGSPPSAEPGQPKVNHGKWGEALQAAGLPPKEDPYKPPRPLSPGPPPPPPTPPK